MAEDKKKEVVKTEVSLQRDVEMIAALRLEIEELSAKLAGQVKERDAHILSLKNDVKELTTMLEAAVAKVALDGQVIVDGKKYVIVDKDTAWEVGQKVEKSFVEEDALTLVLSEVK